MEMETFETLDPAEESERVDDLGSDMEITSGSAVESSMVVEDIESVGEVVAVTEKVTVTESEAESESVEVSVVVALDSVDGTVADVPLSVSSSLVSTSVPSIFNEQEALERINMKLEDGSQFIQMEDESVINAENENELTSSQREGEGDYSWLESDANSIVTVQDPAVRPIEWAAVAINRYDEKLQKLICSYYYHRLLVINSVRFCLMID